jgi:hypothetical protein
MGGHLERRLSRLEQEMTPAMRVAYVWWTPEEETQEQAIAQRFPDGVPGRCPCGAGTLAHAGRGSGH